MRPHRRRRLDAEAEARARDWAYENLRMGIGSRRGDAVSMTRRFCLFMYVPLLATPWVSVDDDGW